MSQIWIGGQGSTPVGPDIETLTGDVGGAVSPDPVTFNINLLTGDGLTSTGVPAAHTITFTLDGFAVGTGTTVGATTADLITITPTDLKSFAIQALVSGYNSANNETFGGELLGVGRKSTTVSIIGTPDKTEENDAGLSAGSYDLVASGGTFIVRVTGVAGKTIAWGARLNYVSSP